MKIILLILSLLAISIPAQSNAATSIESMDKSSFQNAGEIILKGKWIAESNNQAMLDPQTSGLKSWRGKLLSLSDGSAHISQQKQIHVIDPLSGILNELTMPMKLSDKVQKSCFSQYLEDTPDLEGLAVDPSNDNIFYVVTEDARIGGGLSKECKQRFKETGSTVFPTLLVRLELQVDNSVLMTHVRPIQFKASFNVGDFSNDGIEGIAIGKDKILYLALEKDSNKQARIFTTVLTEHFWVSDDFIKVEDPQFNLPVFVKGNHPINGIDYLQVENHPGYLVAAARNDNQLWIIDIAKQKPTKVLSLSFLAPTNVTDQSCSKWDELNNTSIEGVAVYNDQIWLVNDPWKKNYLKNIKCDSNRTKFERMSPLLFSLPISDDWLN